MFTLSSFHFTTKSSSKCSRKHMATQCLIQNLENNKRNTDYAAAAGQMSSLLFTAIFSLYLYVMKPLFTSYHAELLKSLTTHSTLLFEHLGLHQGALGFEKSGIFKNMVSTFSAKIPFFFNHACHNFLR